MKAAFVNFSFILFLFAVIISPVIGQQVAPQLAVPDVKDIRGWVARVTEIFWKPTHGPSNPFPPGQVSIFAGYPPQKINPFRRNVHFSSIDVDPIRTLLGGSDDEETSPNTTTGGSNETDIGNSTLTTANPEITGAHPRNLRFPDLFPKQLQGGNQHVRFGSGGWSGSGSGLPYVQGSPGNNPSPGPINPRKPETIFESTPQGGIKGRGRVQQLLGYLPFALPILLSAGSHLLPPSALPFKQRKQAVISAAQSAVPIRPIGFGHALEQDIRGSVGGFGDALAVDLQRHSRPAVPPPQRFLPARLPIQPTIQHPFSGSAFRPPTFPAAAHRGFVPERPVDYPRAPPDPFISSGPSPPLLSGRFGGRPEQSPKPPMIAGADPAVFLPGTGLIGNGAVPLPMWDRNDGFVGPQRL